MELVICGDFNIKFYKESILNQQITLPFQSHNLFQAINFPTRISKVYSSAFDNIFVDCGRINSHCVLPTINGLSDPEAQYLVLNDVFNHHKDKKQSFRTRAIPKEAITEQYINENWAKSYRTKM
jgi:hypothetical protein